MNAIPVNSDNVETRKELSAHFDRIEAAKMTTRTEVHHKDGVLMSASMFLSNVVSRTDK